MRVKFNIWAPPGNMWGPWFTLDNRWTSKVMAYEVSFESVSSAPMPFQVEIKYYQGSLEKKDVIGGPGSHKFGHGMCYCVSEIRARTMTIGQIIEVTAVGP